MAQASFTSRPFFDYTRMFDLDDRDIEAKRILDCPGGGSPFAAQVNLRGGNCTAVDPTYSLGLNEIISLLEREGIRDRSWVESAKGANLNFFGSSESASRVRDAAAQVFLNDFIAHRERYVAGKLPSLPFASGDFDLVVCSHLLFCYPTDPAGLEVEYIIELCRVSRGEVRIFPLVDIHGEIFMDVERVRQTLHQKEIVTKILEVVPSSLMGTSRMLVCTAATKGNTR